MHNNKIMWFDDKIDYHYFETKNSSSLAYTIDKKMIEIFRPLNTKLF